MESNLSARDVDTMVDDPTAMRHAPDSLPHRLVGLLLAVMMPLCCCTAQVLGANLLGSDAAVVASLPSCCSGTTDAEDGDCDDDGPCEGGCNCVRGQLEHGGALDRATDALAHPAIAHPAVHADPTECSPASQDEPILFAHGPPPESQPDRRSPDPRSPDHQV